MASKSDLAAEKKAVKTALSESRSGPISFAALVVKGGVVLETDKRKSVEAVKKVAKSKGGGTRGAWGEMTCSGSSVTLICDSDPASKIDQMVRKYFADRGQSVKVAVKLRSDMEAEQAAQEAPPEPKGKPAQTEALAPKTPPPKQAPKRTTEHQAQTAREPAPEPKANEDKDDTLVEEETVQPGVGPEEAAQTAPAGTAHEAAEAPDDPDDEDDIAAHAGDLEKLLKAAKKKDFFFAWMIGKDAPRLKAHRRRSTKKLVMAARQEGASPRGAWGKMRVEGKKVMLMCDEAPPKSLARRARFHLKDNNLAYKVVCILPSGEMLESDESEDVAEDVDRAVAATSAAETEDATQSATEPDTTPQPRETPAEAVLREMAPNFTAGDQILALFSSATKDAARLKTKLDAARSAALAGDKAQAKLHLEQMAQMARETPRTPQARRARSIGALIDMKPDILQTARDHAPARGYLTELCKSCIDAADTRDFETAEARVGQINRAIAAAKAPPLDTVGLERTVAGLMPSEATAPAEYARIAPILRPALAQDHPQKTPVATALRVYMDATGKQDTSARLDAIGQLRHLEATIKDVGPKLGKDGAMRQALKPDTAARLAALLGEGEAS